MNIRGSFPDVRLRRLRQSASVRRLFSTPFIPYHRLLWPVFLVEGENRRIPVASMPGQHRLSIDQLIVDLVPLVQQGLGGVMLFGVIEDEQLKNNQATAAMGPDSLVARAVRAVRAEFPDLVIFTDVCVCAYTNHGHCGVLSPKGQVLNDPSLNLLSQMALSHAEAGATGVAPSAMMDGQVQDIRETLMANGFNNTLIMSYSTKFSSAMYGPFRDAAGSAPGKGDRKSYQQPPDDLSQAIRESLMDEAEGADILMVKPALLYLDVIQKLKAESLLPIAAYNVSGEYAMIHATAEKGWGDLKAMARESLTALNRSGADLILTYWANQYAELTQD